MGRHGLWCDPVCRFCSGIVIMARQGGAGAKAEAATAPALTEIEAALTPSGLILRGGFHPRPEDRVPPLPNGVPAGTLVLVGNAGPSMWRAFRAISPERAISDALDIWTRRVLEAAAATLNAHIVFPFTGPPWLPFQRWARRAEPVSPSPIGPLIHPDYGLWHAYRGALVFASALDLPPPDRRPSPCESCEDKPCLVTCPVAALEPGSYDLPACLDHIASEAGRDCSALSCRARRACPVGTEYAYEPEQAAFHMAAFIRANRPRGP